MEKEINSFKLINSSDEKVFAAWDLNLLIAKLRQVTGATINHDSDLNDETPQKSIVLKCEDRFLEAQMLLATLFDGWRVCALKPEMSEQEVDNVIADLEPMVFLTDKSGAKCQASDKTQCLTFDSLVSDIEIVEVNGQYRIEDISGSLIIYTSGTTELPKQVLLTASMLQANIETAVGFFKYDQEFVSASLLPLHHIFSLMNDLLTMVVLGGTTVVVPLFDIASINTTLDALEVYKVNYFSVVPLICEVLIFLDAPLNSDSIKFLVAGAAPLKLQTSKSFMEKFGIEISACYGMVEASNFITASPIGKDKTGSVGIPVGLELRIMDSGMPVAQDNIGEIEILGDSVIKDGYRIGKSWDVTCYTEDGWLKTGDLGKLDKDGYLFITGRKKNMAIRGGDKIYLEDIDRHLHRMSGISDSGTIVVLDLEGQDRIVSFISFQQENDSEVNADKIKASVRRKMGVRFVPDDVITFNTIPRSPTGKLKMKQLVDHYMALKQSGTTRVVNVI